MDISNEGQASPRDRKPGAVPMLSLQLGEFPAKRSTETGRSHGESGTCPRVSRQSLESKLTVAAGVCRTGPNTVTHERAESMAKVESEETTQLQGRRIQEAARKTPDTHTGPGTSGDAPDYSSCSQLKAS